MQAEGEGAPAPGQAAPEQGAMRGKPPTFRRRQCRILELPVLVSQRLQRDGGGRRRGTQTLERQSKLRLATKMCARAGQVECTAGREQQQVCQPCCGVQASATSAQCAPPPSPAGPAPCAWPPHPTGAACSARTGAGGRAAGAPRAPCRPAPAAPAARGAGWGRQGGEKVGLRAGLGTPAERRQATGAHSCISQARKAHEPSQSSLPSLARTHPLVLPPAAAPQQACTIQPRGNAMQQTRERHRCLPWHHPPSGTRAGCSSPAGRPAPP